MLTIIIILLISSDVVIIFLNSDVKSDEYWMSEKVLNFIKY